MDDRVAILGYGMVSSVGNNAEETWLNVISGRVGLKQLPQHISALVRSKQAHLVDFPYTDNRLVKLATQAADEAINRAGYSKIDAICVGSTSASFASIEKKILMDQLTDSSHLKPSTLVKGLAEYYSIDPRRTLQCSQACASSACAIAIGVDLIKQGYAKVVLAGGADEVTASVIAGFESCRIHARVCRPFDEARRGLVLGEAAAFVILSDARWTGDRGFPVVAYVDGVGLTCDAYHMSSQDPSGSGIIRAIESAIGGFEKTSKTSIDLICAHGTGTRHNDAIEAACLNRVFGKGIPPVASYKGSLGHPQGASGVCGIVLALQALKYNLMFPNVGLQKQDKSIQLNIVQKARHEEIHKVLCLSYGSWGANAALVIAAPKINRG